jgi:hypothetical protein
MALIPDGSRVAWRPSPALPGRFAAALPPHVWTSVSSTETGATVVSRTMMSPINVPAPGPSRMVPSAQKFVRGPGIVGICYLVFCWFAFGRDLPVVCPYRFMTGWRCPLCGLSTGIGHALHGRPARATRIHVMSVPAILAAILLIGASVRGDDR